MMHRILLTLTLAGLLTTGCAAINALGFGPDDTKKNPRVLLKTNVGEITLELFGKDAPITVNNFLRYANDGHYEGLIFHRVIPGFMIQGGGHTPDLGEKPTYGPIKNEAGNGLSNTRGTISMARTMEIDSATDQFFINLVDNKRLDHNGAHPSQYGYAVFGRVVKGMEIVEAIAGQKTLCPSSSDPTECEPPLPDDMQDVPESPIIIQAIETIS
ncbi:MAG: peptidylprolyl isomerase [Myxococcota bacterium]|nr:peptidylprolyl isomerase [Myxococcota bacterium]